MRFESRNDLERRNSDEYEIRFEEGSFDGLVQCDGIDRSRVSLHVLIQRVECVGFRLLGEVLTHRIVPNLLNGVDACEQHDQSNLLDCKSRRLTRVEIVQDSTLPTADDTVLQVGKISSDLVDSGW